MRLLQGEEAPACQVPEGRVAPQEGPWAFWLLLPESRVDEDRVPLLDEGDEGHT